MITSLQNNQVKNIIKLNQKAKARREQGLFIAEGRKMFLEAPLHWIEKVYVSETVEKQDTEVMEKETSDHGSGGSAGSGKCGNHFPYSGGRWRGWYFSYKNLCGYYKSQSDPCYNGISIQNALCVCGRCGIPERDAPGQENSVFCRSFAG